MKKQIQNEDIDSQIAPNQKARNRLKKKRLNEDTNTSFKVSPNKSNIEINSLGVYDGGYTVKRGLDNSKLTHNNTIKLDQQNVTQKGQTAKQTKEDLIQLKNKPKQDGDAQEHSNKEACIDRPMDMLGGEFVTHEGINNVAQDSNMVLQ
ncbi:hypothetical protein TSUD_370370 [Trifolium subterraneum]|uniref:Uncharacterized protein n=1 Tax=Trifolium subterraneum TaxID=3900 RepID=A0A2Z6P6L8_TRISU|nr:hypothetical protein TSUD_370370 [Trifolium subterraneum]